MNRECSYCSREALYGVEPTIDTTMYLYLCQLDFDLHKELVGEVSFWKLLPLEAEKRLRQKVLEIKLEADLVDAGRENAEDFAYCYARYEIPF